MSAVSEATPFVFLDDRPWPYLVKQHSNGDWWLYYWVKGPKNFASLRQVGLSEVELFRAFALPPEKAALYLRPDEVRE